jgi:HlyD family secretion protein
LRRCNPGYFFAQLISKYSRFSEVHSMTQATAHQASPKPAIWRQWKWLGIPATLILLKVSGFNPVAMLPGRQSPSNVVTQAIERKTIPIRISANGTVNAQRSINLSPKTAGVIKTLLVKEGDQVRQGQVIATMDDNNLRGQFTQMQGQLAQQEANLQRLIAGNRPEDIAKAEAQLAEAEANLQQLRSGNRPQEIAQGAARLQQAQATLKQRETDLQRNQELYNAGAISRQTVDQKVTDRDVARTQVMEAEQGLALQNAGTRPELIEQAQARVNQQAQTVVALKAGNRSEDIDAARAQVQAARGALQTIEAQLNETSVTAPFDGIVLKKYADVGSFVSPSVAGGGTGGTTSSSSILQLSGDRRQVVVNLSEAQIAKVKLGQSVTIKADAVPGETFTGKVEQIAPQAAMTQNVTSFEVRVAIDAPGQSQLKVGMNVETEFAVGQLENALVLPNAAVVRQADGTGVYVLDRDRKPVFQPIQTGITAGSQTEVKSGLQGNEQVLLSPPPKATTGGGGFGLPKAPPQ